MPIINGVWFADPTRSNVEALTTSFKAEHLGDFNSGPQIYSPSCNMPPTINFSSPVFEHDGDFNLKLTGIDDPNLTCTVRELFTLRGHPTKEEMNDKSQQVDLDFEDLEESSDEINPFESHRIYIASHDWTPPLDEARSLATRLPPRLSNAPTLNTTAPFLAPQSTLAPRNLSSDFRAAQDDNIQLKTLLNTMRALAEHGSPLAKVIEQAKDLADKTKQCIDAKAAQSRSQSRGQNPHPEGSN